MKTWPKDSESMEGKKTEKKNPANTKFKKRIYLVRRNFLTPCMCNL